MHALVACGGAPSLRREGELLAKKNGDQESSLRKLRASSREAEVERDRLQGQVAAMEGQLQALRERVEADAAQVRGSGALSEEADGRWSSRDLRGARRREEGERYR